MAMTLFGIYWVTLPYAYARNGQRAGAGKINEEYRQEICALCADVAWRRNAIKQYIQVRLDA